MKLFLRLFLLMALVASAACEAPMSRPKSNDSASVVAQVMSLYGYQPERALQVLDSASRTGAISPFFADLNRARIYSQTQMSRRLDSLMQWGEGERFDSARVIGERLLLDDSVRSSLPNQQNVLEILAYTARRQQDTLLWLKRSHELLDVCHQLGAETEALRTEAEIGAILCYMGQHQQGMERLDSVIAQLQHGRFNELDAQIIAIKRKVEVLRSSGRYVETLPLAHRIIDRLDDYEQHPALYHDSTYREPPTPADRDDYIRFYRRQAQNYIFSAYSTLGQPDSVAMLYKKIEEGVKEAAASEHMARQRELEQQMLRADAERHSRMMTFVALTALAVLLIILFFASYIFMQNQRIRRKNHALVRMMEVEEQRRKDKADAAAPCEMPAEEPADQTDVSLAVYHASLFQTIDARIRNERLYADANIQRTDICNRFNIRREVLAKLVTDNTGAQSFPAYINGIRLSEACRLLTSNPSMTVNAIADEVGLSPRNLRRLFVERYGMTPTEYRRSL